MLYSLLQKWLFLASWLWFVITTAVARHAILQAQIGTHFFGHAYLSSLLLPTLKQSAPSRIVWTTSAAETSGDVDWDNLP